MQPFDQNDPMPRTTVTTTVHATQLMPLTWGLPTHGVVASDYTAAATTTTFTTAPAMDAYMSGRRPMAPYNHHPHYPSHEVSCPIINRHYQSAVSVSSPFFPFRMNSYRSQHDLSCLTTVVSPIRNPDPCLSTQSSTSTPSSPF